MDQNPSQMLTSASSSLSLIWTFINLNFNLNLNHFFHHTANMVSSDPEDFIDDDGDLFGDDEEAGSPKERLLSDRELDSGDDEDRNDRAGDQMDGVEEPASRDARILGAEISRHPLPNPSNGEVRVPSSCRKFNG
jgi:hypothetical protein